MVIWKQQTLLEYILRSGLRSRCSSGPIAREMAVQDHVHSDLNYQNCRETTSLLREVGPLLPLWAPEEICSAIFSTAVSLSDWWRSASFNPNTERDQQGSDFPVGVVRHSSSEPYYLS